MRNRIALNIILLGVAIFAFPLPGLTAERYQWKFAGEENGCRIYISEVAGKDYIAAKATCVIPARMDVVGVILRDIAGYPGWMHDCSETRILKVADEANDVLIFWMRQHIALFTDRDMVLKSKTVCKQESGQCFVYTESTREMSYDSGTGYVRMPSFRSQFVLEWIDEKHTRVTFSIDPDLGRGIPVSAANRTIRSLPSLSLKAMAEMAKQQKYADSARTSKYAKLVEDYLRTGKK